MISPILPTHDADTIALDLGIFIARQSRYYRCSRDAVMAVIREALPSQPEAPSKPHAPAADTPATQAAGDTTDGEEPPNDAPSVTPIPEAPKPLPDAPDNPADALSQPAEAKTSDQADGGAVSAVNVANARLESAEGAEPPPSTDQPEAGSHLSEAQRYAFERVRAEFEADPSRSNKEIAHAAKCNMARANAWLKQFRADKAADTTTALAAEVAEVAKPKAAPTPKKSKEKPQASSAEAPTRVTLKQRVAEVHEQHPDWTAKSVAQHLGEKFGSVKPALFDAKSARLARIQAHEPAPLPNPQKPVAPPPPERTTPQGRIQTLHSQHPNWTPAMLSKALGVPVDAVLRALGKARQQEAEMVGGEAAQRAHYSEVAKRLGKPS